MQKSPQREWHGLTATTNTEVPHEKVSICSQCCAVQASTAISVPSRCPLADHPAALGNRHPTTSDFPSCWQDPVTILLLNGYQIPALMRWPPGRRQTAPEGLGFPQLLRHINSLQIPLIDLCVLSGFKRLFLAPESLPRNQQWINESPFRIPEEKCIGEPTGLSPNPAQISLGANLSCLSAFLTSFPFPWHLTILFPRLKAQEMPALGVSNHTSEESL